MYIESFRYSLEKHLAKVDTYLCNINMISKSNFDVELAFLIEIYSDFANTFLTANGSTKSTDATFVPIFEDIVQMLESIDRRKVNYIILCFNQCLPLSSERAKVISLRTNGLRKQLERQHIQIFSYAGERFPQIPARISPTFTHGGDVINLEMTMASFEPDMDSLMEQIIPAFLDALTYEKNKKRYISTARVQLMVELFGEYYIKYGNLQSDIAKDLWKIIMKIDGEKIREKWEELQKLWHSEGKEEMK